MSIEFLHTIEHSTTTSKMLSPIIISHLWIKAYLLHHTELCQSVYSKSHDTLYVILYTWQSIGILDDNNKEDIYIVPSVVEELKKTFYLFKVICQDQGRDIALENDILEIHKRSKIYMDRTPFHENDTKNDYSNV